MRGCRGVEPPRPRPRPSLPGFPRKLSIHRLKVPHSPSITKHLDLSWKGVCERMTLLCDCFGLVGGRPRTKK